MILRDGSNSGWLGSYPHGQQVNASHIWNKKGTYLIKVKTKDVLGKESDWSDPLSINMPRNKVINTPFLNYLQNHPNLFPILQKIIQRLGLQ
jgi:hypothetical protein